MRTLPGQANHRLAELAPILLWARVEWSFMIQSPIGGAQKQRISPGRHGAMQAWKAPSPVGPKCQLKAR
jgi:hypothetical protein